MSTAADRTYTEDDLYALTGDERHELVAGALVSEPAPKWTHAHVQMRLSKLLAEYADASGAGHAVGPTGYVLARDPDTVRVPDLSFVGNLRLAAMGDPARFLVGAPDLAVEILSPSDRPNEMHAKVADYLAAGARCVWVVDPSSRSVRVYRTLLQSRRVEEGDLLEEEDVLPGFSVPVKTLFD